jgi:hypothetical protein
MSRILADMSVWGWGESERHGISGREIAHDRERAGPIQDEEEPFPRSGGMGEGEDPRTHRNHEGGLEETWSRRLRGIRVGRKPGRRGKAEARGEIHRHAVDAEGKGAGDQGARVGEKDFDPGLGLSPKPG